jgi:hypothetical protein
MTPGTVKAARDTLKRCGVPDIDVAAYSAMSLKSPFMNAQFRKLCLKLGYESKENATELWILCSRDPLFFLNTFGWLLETRSKQDWNTKDRYGTNKIIPFITRGYQDRVIMEVIQYLGRQDIAIPKSRETGISWLMIGVAAWDWIFHDQTHIGFVSKDLLSANNPDDPDALFSKFDFLIRHLPHWILSSSEYERNVARNTYKNLLNESSLTAYAAKGEIGRGGRKRWMLLDEFHFFEEGDDKAAMDSTVHVTPCRVFVSTANRERGMSGAFYDVVSDDTRNGIIIKVDWKDDPEKRRGLYHSELIAGTETYKLVIDDMDFWRPYCNYDEAKTFRHPNLKEGNYPFILDGRNRSLYYDHVWNRPGSTAQSVAAELDQNFGGATAQIFDPVLLEKLTLAVDPIKITGDICRNPENVIDWIFLKLPLGGLTSLWCPLDASNMPPKSEYVFGADISAGTGGAFSSYSALEGLDKKTGEQVFEWRGNRLDPIQFADLAVWVCKWFYNAYLVPEVNGPLGQLFINKVCQELKYLNVFRQIKQKVAVREPTDRIGYVNNDRGIELLKTLESKARKGRVKPQSKIALNECGRYFMKGGKLVHSAAESTDDGAAMGLAHGDAAIAIGCASFGIDDIPVRREPTQPSEAPYLSPLWRRLQHEKAMKAKQHKSYWHED